MSLNIGELFAGYGGLGMGVASVLDAEIAWYSEVDKGALKVLAHRFPGVPNIGDITTADWSQVPPVDILTGGSPCQDLSHAGKRAGMTTGTRSNLWVAMREAIAQLRPRLVIWENVEGAASAAADSEVEPCPGCVGDGPGVHLRALGRVVGDLSSLGYVGRVGSLRAADVGAPHGRRRRFLAASRGGVDAAKDAAVRGPAGRPADAVPPLRAGDGHGPAAADRAQQLLPTPRATDGTKGGPNQRGSSGDLMLPSAVHLLPAPMANEGEKAGQTTREDGGQQYLTHVVHALLPTPAVNDMGAAYTPETWDAWCAAQQAKHGNGNGHGKSLEIEAQRLLPTPSAIDGNGGPKRIRDDGRTEADHGPALRDFASTDRWGQYAAAIHRWEQITRPAPPPTETGPKGNPRLSARFSEWLMGLPDGWITDVPGITRNEALKMCGNGVVPQQAAAAVRFLLAALSERSVA